MFDPSVVSRFLVRVGPVVMVAGALTVGACIPTEETIVDGDEGLVEPFGDDADESSDDEVDSFGATPDGRAATVMRVIDGDSLELGIDGVETEVRLLGINAPELFQPIGDGSDVRTCNGAAATDALAELLGDGPLTVVGDEEDRFGRLLVEIFVGDLSVSGTMVDEGWALAGIDDSDLGPRMEQAAADRRGIWGSNCGAPQADGLRIGDTQIDSPGPDEENLESEWVTVVNDGSEAVDLTGWEIRDETTSNRFVLNGTIDAGGTLRIRTGSGSSNAEDLYLGEDFPIWSNGGDTVVLSDPAGVVAAWAFLRGS